MEKLREPHPLIQLYGIVDLPMLTQLEFHGRFVARVTGKTISGHLSRIKNRRRFLPSTVSGITRLVPKLTLVPKVHAPLQATPLALLHPFYFLLVPR